MKIQQDSRASVSALCLSWTHVHGWPLITVLPNEKIWREHTKHNTKARTESIYFEKASLDLWDGESKPFFWRKCLKIFFLWHLINIKFLTNAIWSGFWMLVLGVTLLVNTLSQACHGRTVRDQQKLLITQLLEIKMYHRTTCLASTFKMIPRWLESSLRELWIQK